MSSTDKVLGAKDQQRSKRLNVTETESEARSIATNLQLLLPANSYEARRHTPSLCCYGIQGCTKGNVIHECGKVRPEEC